MKFTIKALITFLLLFVFSFCLKTNAQQVNYIYYYQNIETAYQTGVFMDQPDSVIYYLEQAFKAAPPYPEDLLVLSDAFCNINEITPSWNNLFEATKRGLDSISIIKSQLYAHLKKEKHEELFAESAKYVCSFDKKLSTQLDSVITLDQSNRKAFFSNSDDTKSAELETVMFRQDSLNREWLLSVINESGWPGRKLIGNDRRSFVLLLHIKKPWIDQYFDLLKSEITKGNLNPCYLAATIDRYMFRKGGIQYGSYLPGRMAFAESSEMKAKRHEIGALSNKVFFVRGKIKVKEE